jgi:hypothetical protein
VGDGTLLLSSILFRLFSNSTSVSTLLQILHQTGNIKLWKEIQLNLNQTVTPMYLQQLCEKKGTEEIKKTEITDCRTQIFITRSLLTSEQKISSIMVPVDYYYYYYSIGSLAVHPWVGLALLNELLPLPS